MNRLISSVCPCLYSEKPSLIEYLSYNLNFLSVLVGPCSNYKDYRDFIEGRHISERLRQQPATCNGHNGSEKTLEPSPTVGSNFGPSVCLSVKLFYARLGFARGKS